VFNQFTEQFSVTDLASRVQAAAARAGKQIDIQHVPNPRIEKEAHYYNAKHSKLPELGLKPNLLTDEELDRMFETVQRHSSRVNHDLMLPTIAWAQK
jgi:UDP-sulfoquinovose synthase